MNKLIVLNAVFVVSLVIANVIAGKVIMVFDYFVLPAAVVAYGITFLCTDVINELYGKDEAKKTVKLGFVMQIMASLLILMGYYLPVAPFATETQEAYKVLLGQNWRFVAASMTAYLIAQTIDINIFSKLKGVTAGKHKWLRNNVSTGVSQFVDTSIFITIAFWGVVPNLWIMIVSQFAFKLVIALIDTPIFYLLTGRGFGAYRSGRMWQKKVR